MACISSGEEQLLSPHCCGYKHAEAARIYSIYRQILSEDHLRDLNHKGKEEMRFPDKVSQGPPSTRMITSGEDTSNQTIPAIACPQWGAVPMLSAIGMIELCKRRHFHQRYALSLVNETGAILFVVTFSLFCKKISSTRGLFSIWKNFRIAILSGTKGNMSVVSAGCLFFRENRDSKMVASKMLLEGEALSWASNALTCSGTVGNRSGSRLHCSGKRKSTLDSARPPKLKQSRILELDEGISILNSGIQVSEGASVQVGSSEVTTTVGAKIDDMPVLMSQLGFHMDAVSESLVSASVTDIQDDTFGSNSIYDVSDLPFDSCQIVPHHYDADFISRCQDTEILSGHIAFLLKVLDGMPLEDRSPP
eukprot:Gb_04359 [translate_table: standard]